MITDVKKFVGREMDQTELTRQDEVMTLRESLNVFQMSNLSGVQLPYGNDFDDTWLEVENEDDLTSIDYAKQISDSQMFNQLSKIISSIKEPTNGNKEPQQTNGEPKVQAAQQPKQE